MALLSLVKYALPLPTLSSSSCPHPSPSLVRIKLNLSLYRISFKAFEEEKGEEEQRQAVGRALEEGALGDSEQGQEGKEGEGQRETDGVGWRELCLQNSSSTLEDGWALQRRRIEGRSAFRNVEAITRDLPSPSPHGGSELSVGFRFSSTCGS